MGASDNSAASQTLMFSFTDSAGWQQLDVVNILLNSSLNGGQACYLAYSRPSNTLYLVNNAGNALLPGLVLDHAGTLSNGQCTIGPAMAAGSGNTLTLTLNVAASSTFKGSRIFYLAARDGVGGNSGWQPMGTWNVP